MNKTQMLLNEIKLNPGTTLKELEVFANANDIKTYKGLITKAKNQEMIILEGEKHTITEKGIEYINHNPKAKTNQSKAKREIIIKDKQQEMYDLQQELLNIFNSENMTMNTIKHNRINQICKRMIAIGEQSKDHSQEAKNDTKE